MTVLPSRLKPSSPSCRDLRPGEDFASPETGLPYGLGTGSLKLIS